ncbi:MAG: alpha/beta fold hydrolase [Anaerolineae bacterium]
MKRNQVEVAGERIGYTLYELDGRTEQQRRAKTVDGNLNVFIPGHGQTADAAKALIATIVRFSSSKVVWSIDVDPPRGGDAARAEAVIKIVESKAARELVPGGAEGRDSRPPIKATLFGWSHGGAEALRAAERAPELFGDVVALCPAGLVERSLQELVWSFLLECLRILGAAVLRPNRALGRTLALGANMLAGVTRDLVRSRSLHRVIDDIRWVTDRVTGDDYAYDGRVVILFAEEDTVIRWRDLLPDCGDPDQIAQFVQEYRGRDLPKVRELHVRVLGGNHIAPELNPGLYIKTALDLLSS